MSTKYNQAELEKEGDEYLMLAFQDGSTAAFELLVKRYKNKIFNYIYKYTGDRLSSEELAQEVFIRVYKCRERYQVTAKFNTFIYRIAMNLAYNEVRNRKRRKTEATENFFFLQDKSTPETQFEREEMAEFINMEIQKLPAKLKDVVILCNVQSNSYKKASEILNVSVGTIQSRLSRARKILRKNLSKVLNLDGEMKL